MSCTVGIGWAAALGLMQGYELDITKDEVVLHHLETNVNHAVVEMEDCEAVYTFKVTGIQPDGTRQSTENSGTLTDMQWEAGMEPMPQEFAVHHPPEEAGDFDGDGVIGFPDYGIFISVFGSTRE